MEEQVRKTKVAGAERRRVFTIVGSLAIFIVAVFLVTLLTANHNKHAVKTATVVITAKGFQPATLTVEQGTKVTWTNSDSTLHQITANPFPQGTSLSSLKSQILNNNQTYTYVASTKGTFGYHDQLKPTINGTLIVQKK